MYSVVHYFGIDRAYGIDHFEPELYRNKTFVKQGMFKYTDNAMYKFGFLDFVVNCTFYFVESCFAGSRIQSSLYLGAFLLHRITRYSSHLR